MSKMIPVVLIVILSVPLFYYILFYPDKRNNDTENRLDMVIGFYISGEDFLQQLIDEDISDTLGLSSDRIEFYYLVDYSGFGNTEFFHARNYTKIPLNISQILPYDSSELDMGSDEVFAGFVDYISDIEAKDHCLIIWGHGRGYEGVCFDGSSMLTGKEIGSSLTGKGIDLLIFDACEMICAEFLYELRDPVRYILGSEKDIPDRGLDYSGGFTRFFGSNSRDIKNLAIDIMDETFSYYSRNPSRFSLQLSLIDMSDFMAFSRDFTSSFLTENSIYPDRFESGKRFDLGLLLEMNNETCLLRTLEDSIEYLMILPSTSGVPVKGLYGISVLSPEFTEDGIDNPFLL
ncbi:MAG: hypothetical protein JXA22_05610 [Candidatus Thermoplasmatota archaeon]|nr:hypothetical protein [Candidatus Thermoplasmatota archaeon]